MSSCCELPKVMHSRDKVIIIIIIIIIIMIIIVIIVVVVVFVFFFYIALPKIQRQLKVEQEWVLAQNPGVSSYYYFFSYFPNLLFCLAVIGRR